MIAAFFCLTNLEYYFIIISESRENMTISEFRKKTV